MEEMMTPDWILSGRGIFGFGLCTAFDRMRMVEMGCLDYLETLLF